MNLFDRLLGRNRYIKGWDFRQYNPTTNYNDYAADLEKINAVFQSPAVLKVFKTECDLFSLGKIKMINRNTGEEIEQDPLLNLIKNPNPFQTQRQLLWDYKFWRMLGNSVLYTESQVATKEANKLYFLDTSKIEYPTKTLQDVDKLIFSKEKLRDYNDFKITYRYSDGSTKDIENKKLLRFFDLTNGTGNWFKGNSSIDALYKVISNSELALDAINVNTLMSKKFMVTGKASIEDTRHMPMGATEKKSIEDNVMTNKNVHAVKSLVEIKRFVEDLSKLQLNEMYRDQATIIGNLYGIPKEVLGYSGDDSTYENQEKAIGKHIGYNMQPAGDDLVNGIEKHFGYNDTEKDLIMTWDHLPFMQVFENERAEVEYKKAQTLNELINAGVDNEEAGLHLNYNFKNYGDLQRRENSGTEA